MNIYQGSHPPGKSWKVRESQGIWVVRDSHGKSWNFIKNHKIFLTAGH